MKIAVDRGTLEDALALASQIADRKSTVQLHANVLLRATGATTLQVAAVESTMSASTEVECQVDEPGDVSVSAKHLHDIVKAMRGEHVFISLSEQDGAVVAQVKCGKSAFKVATLPSKSFPRVPTPPKKMGQIPGPVFRDGLGKTLYAASTDTQSPSLNGVHFESVDGVALLASADRHRMAIAHKQVPGLDLPGVLISRRACAEILKVAAAAATVEIGTNKRELFVRIDKTMVVAHLLEAESQARSVVGKVPGENHHVVTCNRAELVDALRRVSLASDPLRNSAVTLYLKPGVLSLSVSSATGQADEDIAVQYEGPIHPPLDLSAPYLVDAIEKADGDEITLSLPANEYHPVAVQAPRDADSYLAYVMPVAR